MPPVAGRDCAYGRLTVASGSDPLGIVTGAPVARIVMLEVPDNLAPPASLTVIMTTDVPAAVGVPDIAPVPLMESPAGRPLAENEYGCNPPIPFTEAVYGVPASPTGNPGMFSPRTVMTSEALALWPPESETLTVALNTPGCEAEPEMAPLLFMETPPGRPVALKV